MQDLVLQPGIKPMDPAVEVLSPNHWTTRKVSQIVFYTETKPREGFFFFQAPWKFSTQWKLIVCPINNLLEK